MEPPPTTIETRMFELEEEPPGELLGKPTGEPGRKPGTGGGLRRIVRGRIDSPRGAEEAGEPLPVVLVLHGFKGFMNWGFFPTLSRRIAGAGFVAISFNMSGSGVGEDLENITDDAAFAANTPTRELEDTDAVRGFVQSGAIPWVDPERIAIFGHSLGGGIALLHAAEHADLRAIVTWAAVSSVERFGPEAIVAWRREGYLSIPNARTGQIHRLDRAWLEDVEENAAALDVRAACRRLRTPTLLVHGTADEAVGPAEVDALVGAFPPGVARLLSMEGSGHTFGATHPMGRMPAELERVLEATIAHLQEHRGGSAAGDHSSTRIVSPPEERSSMR
ncbi:MAG: alpha/beta fold hydrolase [Planctomycetota bacterium]